MTLAQQYIEPTLDKCRPTMFERKASCPANTKHLYNIYTTSAPNVFDVGPTLHKVIQMFCVYWVSIIWVIPGACSRGGGAQQARAPYKFLKFFFIVFLGRQSCRGLHVTNGSQLIPPTNSSPYQLSPSSHPG